MSKKQLIVEVATTAESDVKEILKNKVTEEIQKVLDDCSKDYFRTVKATVALEIE